MARLEQSGKEDAASATPDSADEIARMARELAEAREQQVATSEILQAIARAPKDLPAVLDAIVATAARLCRADKAHIRRFDDGLYRVTASFGHAAEEVAYIERHPVEAGRGTLSSRTALDLKTIHVPDVLADPEWARPDLAQIVGLRSGLGVPLLREGKLTGVLILARTTVAPFTAREIEMAETFAAQAVIAIENTRLFGETAAALERETAMSGVLRIISGSPTDLRPVLDAIAENAARLCATDEAVIWRRDGDALRLAAAWGTTPNYENTLPVSRRSVVGRALLDRATVDVPDLAQVFASEFPESRRLMEGGYRSLLAAPLLRQDEAIGVIIVRRGQVRPYTEQQIALLRTFADQAVIAIENTRLFEEVQSRNHDLSESLEQQTVTAAVLGVIARSPTDLKPVLNVVAENAARLCDAYDSILLLVDGDSLREVAHYGPIPSLGDERRPLVPGTLMGRAVLENRIIHVHDSLNSEEFPDGRARAARFGFRTSLGVPLQRDGKAFGILIIRRAEVRPFSDRQITLLQTFADQAVIAIENTRLFEEVQSRNRDLAESLEQQTATAEVLGVIARSPTDLEPVLNVVAENAARLCAARDGVIVLVDGDALRQVAHFGPIPGLDGDRYPVADGTVMGRTVREGRIVHVHDLSTSSEFPEGREIALRLGHRSIVGAPLMRDGQAFGALIVRRTEVRPFSDRQITLLQTFADQAVIAIANTRLFDEVQTRNRDLTEALERQTATAEILGVIASSPTDLKPVLDVVVTNAARLCAAFDCALVVADGDTLRELAHHGPIPFLGDDRFPLTRASVMGRAVLDGEIIHVPDLADSTEFPEGSALARRHGNRTTLAAPLLREGKAFGALVVRRKEVRPFSDAQIALLRTFADQAVIAIENTRLFEQLQARTGELGESLEYQTASSEVLNAISRSPNDLRPVVDAVLNIAVRLCDAEYAILYRLEADGRCHLAGTSNTAVALADYVREHPIDVDSRTLAGRVMLRSCTIHLPDCLADPEYTRLDFQRLGQMRTMLGVPLLRDGRPIGVFTLVRNVVRPFTDRQIELITTFADQAVIAINNVGLFEEVQARTSELTESLEYQTATSEVLGVISRSPTDVQPVLDAVVRSAARLCEADFAIICRRDGETYPIAASVGLSAAQHEHFTRYATTPDRGSIFGRAIIEGRAIHVPDVLADPEFGRPQVRQVVDLRSGISLPLMREGAAIGVITMFRRQPRAFSQRQIDLVATFADQAVIAIENARLFNETKEALERQTAMSEILRIISTSATDLQPVLDAIARNAARLCATDDVFVWLLDGETLRQGAAWGPDPMGRVRLPNNRRSPAGRAIHDRRPVHVQDFAEVFATEFPDAPALIAHGYRSVLAVPLLGTKEAMGAIVVRRREIRPFSDAQIELLRTFADQAVIAIENTRLFEEVQSRNRDLTESLEQQTATAEVLGVIARSPTDLKPVLDVVVENAARLCGAYDSLLTLVDGEVLREVAHYGPIPSPGEERRALTRGTVSGRAVIESRAVHIHDILDTEDFPEGRARGERFGFRTTLAVPLLRDGKAFGVLLIRRAEVRPFTDRQIGLLQTFADQAVIAINNVGLFDEVQARNRDLGESLEQQMATGEVLQAIARSPTDLQPVLDTVVRNAARLCEAVNASVFRIEGNLIRRVAGHGRVMTNLRVGEARSLDRGSLSGRCIVDGVAVNIPDFQAIDLAREFPHVRPGIERDGIRSCLAVPLIREGKPIGALVIIRTEVRPFSERQIRLLETFADQAVIAIENVRLFNETKEALERQTTTADILRIIASSPTDPQPVFDAIVHSAARLFDRDAALRLVEGGNLRSRARSWDDAAVFQGAEVLPIDQDSLLGRVMLAGEADQVVDTQADDADAYARAHADRLTYRSIASAPLMRDGTAIGVLSVRSDAPGRLSDKQMSLLATFADQAAIAIENVRLFNETKEALERQTAMSEVLRIISTSPTDLRPVLDAIAERAARLCATDEALIWRRDGAMVNVAASWGARLVRVSQLPLSRGSPAGRAILELTPVHVPDLAAVVDTEFPDVRLVAQVGYRSILAVPLLSQGEAIGSILVRRSELRPFTEAQIALLRAFADQAVIAIENTRLFEEVQSRNRDLTESLEQQTATAEVLGVIARSPTDLKPVLNVVVENAARLCSAYDSLLLLVDGESLREVAHYGSIPSFGDVRRPLTRDMVMGRTVLESRTVHVHDLLDAADFPGGRERAERLGFRTALGVPLLRDGKAFGVLLIRRAEVRPFTDRQIELVTTFADQAVIAMENARLLDEIRQRQAELRVTFDNMGDGVAMFDAELRLAAWNSNFERIIGIDPAELAQRPTYATYLGLLAERGEFGTGNVEAELASRLEDTERELRLERTRPNGTVVEVRRNAVPDGGFVLIYSDITERKKAEAAIAAARDAAEAALERQTATAEILKVIASSPTDIQPVLDAVADAAVRFCGAPDAVIGLRDGESWLAAAHAGPILSPLGESLPLNREILMGRAIIDGETQYVPDVDALDPAEFSAGRQLQRRMGVRAVLVAPLLREGVAIGAISLRKTVPGPFASHQVELLETFAAQAVIAIENVRLFTELRDSLERLKAAQANLIQAEKMASLGQLTAGIAHEIKNPLNFVNNFASLSVELLDELKEVAGLALATLDENKRAEFEETMELLVGNLGKITEHGKRADGIVRSMLAHSRGGGGDWQPSDINALVEDALNLAYHGARAQDQEFNVTLERDFDKTGKPIDVVPQDVTRVFLNLFGNGFYAANKRRTTAREGGYRPTIKVTTRDLGELVEVRVRDNGTGISPDVQEKLFQPFFTTKPTGEGTGLGLSISYDIVTQQHGGSIAVESEPGSFTEFTVRLPRARRVAVAERA